MKKFTFLLCSFVIFLNSCGSVEKEESSKKELVVTETKKNTEKAKEIIEAEKEGKVINLSTQMFKDLIYNYEESPTEWVYKGSQPCIIDFYADWCGPCKKIAPIMDELAKKYEGKLTVYKVNTDIEKELSQVFQIQSIPLVVGVPMNGSPEAHMGAFEKQIYMQIAEKLISTSKK